MLIAGIWMASAFERTHVKELKTSLERELKILAIGDYWNYSGDEESLIRYYNDLVVKMKEYAGYRLTYIRNDGTVLGDSDHDPRTMDNHLNRDEVKGALQGQTGFATRYSDTLKQNMLYAAIPIYGEDGQVSGVLRIAMSLVKVDASVRDFWIYVFAGMLVLFAIVSFASYRIARSVTRPIEKMTRVAKQIADRNYNTRLTIADHDEIGQLAEAINQMSGSLRSQMNQISENEGRLNSILENMLLGIMMIDVNGRIVLVNPTTELMLGFSSQELIGKMFDGEGQHLPFVKQIEVCQDKMKLVRDELNLHYPNERLVEINVTPIGYGDEEWSGFLVVLHDITELRRLERMRSEFVANVSHELKTPIASVKGFAETLLAGALYDEDTARSFLQIIYNESERLNRLVGDILDLSKIESKRSPLRLSPVHLNVLVDNSIQMVSRAAEQKKITLEFFSEEELYLEADEDRLQQILMNLISNGISYTPEGGKITIRTEAFTVDQTEHADEHDCIRITIADTGIGIPKEDLPRIFERFYRVDKARSRSSGGTGLGLSIVKHLVELHHGSIRVESEVGMGTRFIIVIPVIQS
jgi:two-component system, OmpR family, phosphate regulon sensor histidine kinase PhoR